MFRRVQFARLYPLQQIAGSGGRDVSRGVEIQHFFNLFAAFAIEPLDVGAHNPQPEDFPFFRLYQNLLGLWEHYLLYIQSDSESGWYVPRLCRDAIKRQYAC
jgi:hypothetical protein